MSKAYAEEKKRREEAQKRLAQQPKWKQETVGASSASSNEKEKPKYTVPKPSNNQTYGRNRNDKSASYANNNRYGSNTSDYLNRTSRTANDKSASRYNNNQYQNSIKAKTTGSETHGRISGNATTPTTHGGGGGKIEEKTKAQQVASKSARTVEQSLRHSTMSYASAAADAGRWDSEHGGNTPHFVEESAYSEERKKGLEYLNDKRRDTREKFFEKATAERDDARKRLDSMNKSAGSIEKMWYGALESTTGLGTDLALSAMTGGAVSPLVGMAVRVYGSDIGNKEKEGATREEDRYFALADASKEALTEKMFGGIGITAKVANKAFFNIGDRATRAFMRRIGSNSQVLNFATRLGIANLEEGAEEAAAFGLDPFIEEATYGNNLRKRQAAEALRQQRDAVLGKVTDEASARSAALYFNSSGFHNEAVEQLVKSGVPKDSAEEIAKLQAEYLNTVTTHDVKRAAELEEEISTAMASSHKKDWDFGELMETLGSTAMMVTLTGAPGTVRASRAGAEIKGALGEKGVEALVDNAIGFEDEKVSAKAQAIKDRMEKGKDVSSLQVYDLQQAAMKEVEADVKRREASQKTAAKQIQENGYVSPAAQDAYGNTVMDDATEKRYIDIMEQAEKTISDMADSIESDEGDERHSITGKMVRSGAQAIAGFQTGIMTVEDVNQLTVGNDTARQAFKDVTGVNLDQYNVFNRDGSLNVSKTNAALKDGLFALAADNLVKSAEESTRVWVDETKGRFSSAITTRMDSAGLAAYEQNMSDIDPRNRTEFVRNGSAADMMYQQGKNIGLDWKEVKQYATQIFPDVDESRLEKMYEAGRFDREASMDAVRNATTELNQKMDEVGKDAQPINGRLTVEVKNPENTPADSVVQAYGAISENLGINIHLVDSAEEITGEENKEGESKAKFNGCYDPNTGDMYINVNSGGEVNPGYIFMHEVTHHLKKYAPKEYKELEDLVRQTWFSKDPEGMRVRINELKEFYEETLGEKMTEEQALEELIANSAHEFLEDESFAEQVAKENPSLAESIIGAIKSILSKLRKAIAQIYGNKTYMDSLFSELGILKDAERLWLNAYKAAAERRAIVGLMDWNKEQQSFSVTTENMVLPKGKDIPDSLKKWAKEVGLDTLTNQKIEAPVQVSVKDLRTAWYEKNSRGKEAETINTVFDEIGKMLTRLVGKYNYISLDDAVNASVHYRVDNDGNPTSVYLSCQVKNAEYEVNYDFTTICSKRGPMAKVIEKFIQTEGEKEGNTLYDELNLDEEGMYKLRLILESAGFEVSCKGCFVEQNRYSEQSQAKTVADDWNAALDEWAEKNGTTVTENFDLTTLDTETLDYDEIRRGFERYNEIAGEMRKRKESITAQVKNRILIESSPFFRKRMNPSDYASQSGQKALMAMGVPGGTNLYNLLKRGQGYSKQSVPFTAYNGEVALLPDKMKSKDLVDYLFGIGGARAQSASDFQIEFFYDYMQMVADLAARGLPMHMYTKVIELAELFGMTGIKINMSAMCDVDDTVDYEHAGLKLVDGEWVYNISDQSIDYDKAVALQKKDGYGKNIGIIMVVLSKEHMIKSLDDNDVRYIIGYHSSAMPVPVARMSNMGNATDYTNINKTKKLNDKGRELFARAMEQASGETNLARFKDALRIFDDLIQEEVGKGKTKPRRGNEYARYLSSYKNNTADFDVYEDIKTTKDARKTADNYLEYCMENDLVPMYFPFAFHDNYYKCEIFDYNMYDNVSGEFAPMEAVQNKYPGLDMTKGETDVTAFMDRVSEIMNEQNAKNEVLEPKYKEVFDQAKKQLRFSITGDDYMDISGSGIDHNQLMHRGDAKENLKSPAVAKRDAEYMAAVEAGDMKTAQRMVDEAAKRNGYTPVMRFHGTVNYGHTVFDKANAHPGGNSGAGFYFTTSRDDAERHYADIEGADNYFKANHLAEQILDAGEWDGEPVYDYDEALEIAKNELNQSPGTYKVYLKYKNPYIRDYRNSTPIVLDDDFDESIIDKADYDDEDNYLNDLQTYKDEHIYNKLYRAVYGAYSDIEDNYEVFGLIDIGEVVGRLVDSHYFHNGLNWDIIEDTISQDSFELFNESMDDTSEGSVEFTRAIIENLGYDAVVDKEVTSKFNQLSADTEQDTRHIIVFNSNQIKDSSPVTYDDDGNVVPLSERFNDSNEDIRYSISAIDNKGRLLSKGQREYFKNSKAVDSMGNLVTVYHGTNLGGFTVFDPELSDDKISLFFTSDFEMSQSYVYVKNKIINPYTHQKEARRLLSANAIEVLLGRDELTKEFTDKRISNIEVKDGSGKVVAAGDDFLEVAKTLVRTPGYIEPSFIETLDNKDGNLNEDELVQMAYDAFDLSEFAGYAVEMDYRDATSSTEGTYEVYLNIENPLIIGDPEYTQDWFGIEIPEELMEEMREIIGKRKKDAFSDELDEDDAATTREFARYAYDHGYDGVIFRNIADYGGNDNEYNFKGGDVYVAFSPEQVKDVRNQNPTKDRDIRLSITPQDKITERIAEEAEDIDDVPVEDQVLEEGRQRMAKSKDDFFNNANTKWNERWLTGGQVLKQRSVERDVRLLVMGVMQNSDTAYKYKTSLVKKVMGDVKNAYSRLEEKDYKGATDILWWSARNMVENVDFINDDDFQTYKEFHEYLKKTPIYIGDEYYKDKSYIKFRKDYRGKLLIKNGETNVEEIYDELNKRYPELFSGAATDVAWQLSEIASVVDMLQPYTEAYTSEEVASIATDIANDLLNILMESGESYASVADVYNERYARKTMEMKARHEEALRAVRANRDARLAEKDIRFKIYKQQQREKKEHKKLFGQIEKNLKWLDKALRGGDKNNVILEEFRPYIAHILYCFDMQTEGSKKWEAKHGPGKKVLRMRELKDRYLEISKEGILQYNGFFENIMNVVANASDGKSVDSLSLGELANIDTMLKALTHMLRTYNKVRVMRKTIALEEVAGKVYKDMDGVIKRRGQAKKYKGIRGGLDNIMNMAELTPIYFFQRLGTMYDMYKEVRHGFDQYIRNMQKIEADFKNILGEYQNKKFEDGTTMEDWRNSNSSKTFDFKNGPITLTAAQRMSMYCLANRPQALQHMVGDGVTITEIDAGSKLEKASQWAKGKYERSQSIKLYYEEIMEVAASLTKEQKAVADAMQKYMANDMAELGNAASLDIIGVKIYRDKNYFPIKSSATATDENIEKMPDIIQTIQNPSFSKEIVPKARNVIDIDDIFSVTARHCNGMNLYASYAVPISDFMKVYNAKLWNERAQRFEGVRDAMEMAFGRKAIDYINNFMRDINGSMNQRKDGFVGVLDGLLGRAKRAAVFANVRVALQQPTAIVRAFVEINPVYFAGAVATPSSMREMRQYCPITQWKKWGYYDTHFGRDIEDIMLGVKPGKLEYVSSGIYGSLDNMTWGIIWQAVKKEQAAKHPEMDKNSDEFLRLCGERASDVYDKTQVVDSMFHRSDSMRSKDSMVKQFTSFQAEPTLTFNVLRSGIVEGIDKFRDGDKAGGMAKMAWTASVFAMNAATVSAAAAIWDAVRGKGQPKKEEEALSWIELWQKNFFENLFDNAGIWNNIYVVKDVAPFAEKVVKYARTGEWDMHSNTGIMFQGFETLANGSMMAIKKYQKGEEYDKSWYDITQECLGGLGYFFGIPARTVMKDFKAIGTHFAESAYAAVPVTYIATLSNGEEVKYYNFKEFQAAIEDYREKGTLKSVTREASNSMTRDFLDGIGFEDKAIKGESDEFQGVITEETPLYPAAQAVHDFFAGIGQKYRDKKAEEKAAKEAEKKEQKAKSGGKNGKGPKFSELDDNGKVEWLKEKYGDLPKEEKTKKVWDKLNDGYAEYVQRGDYQYIDRIRKMMKSAGADTAILDTRVFEESKSAFKKSLVYDPSYTDLDRQDSIKDYLLNHGMSEEQISHQILYKSDMAKDLKAAFRIGDEELMKEVLRPLLAAGITRDDIYMLYDNRNRGKDTYTGRYYKQEKEMSSGKLVAPCSGTISSGFGYRSAPTKGASSYHEAIDIAGHVGDPISAADGGTVTYAGWYGGYGYQVRIKHANGTETRYSHLNGYHVKVGQRVKQGDLIAQMGSTGVSTGPHLDFQVKVNGKFVNPLDYVAV